MHKTLKSNLNRYHKQVDYYLQFPKQFSWEQLSFKQNDHEWSMLELLEHLYQIEKATLNFMKNFDFKRRNQVLGFRQKLNYYLLKLSLLSPIEFKVPAVPSLNPEHKHIDVDQLSKEWSMLREQLDTFVEQFPEGKRYHFIFSHPRAGKLDIAQTLGFLHDHAQHHRRQVEKIKRFDGFPKKA